MSSHAVSCACAEAVLDEHLEPRIYFKNVPNEYPKERLLSLVRAFGAVDKVDYMRSSLHNKRLSGFIHMDSFYAAVLAAETIRQASYNGCRFDAHVQTNTKRCVW